MAETISKILVVDDDEITAANIIHALTKPGFHANWVSTGEEAMALLQTENWDAIILDRMLAGMDGISVLAAMKARGFTVPVLMLSALGTINDRIDGLDAGARDYLVKPFAMAELLARINVMIRYDRPTTQEHILNYQSLSLNRIIGSVHIDGQPLQLLPKEFEMLVYFLQNADEVITRQMLLKELWGCSFETGTNVIDVHVSRLRKKIEKLSDRITIKSERGIGYRLIHY